PDPNSAVWAKWDEKLDFMNDGLFYELGLLLPIAKRELDPRLAPEEFRIQINDLRLPPVKGLLPGEMVVNDTAERVNDIARRLSLSVTARQAVSPVTNRLTFAIVSGEQSTAEKLESEGLTTWDPLS